MTLAEKMTRWGILKAELAIIERDIKEEVLMLAQTQHFGGVTAKYDSGRGRYDYEQIAKDLSISEQRIEAFTETKIITDWVTLCKDLVIPEEIRERHYTPGRPSVSVRLDGKKKE